MDADELVRQLRPIRIPAEYAQPGMADALTAFALGILLGLLVYMATRPFLARRVDPVEAVRREIATLAGHPAEERIVGLARLLDRCDAERCRPRPPWLDGALYRKGGAADFAEIEGSILACAEASRRRRRR